MALDVPFTNNYTDNSTREGYQFEFHCQRCGNGYSSSFQHSVTGFGGRLLSLGGGMLGGAVGNRAEQVGMTAEWMRDGNRGSTRDKALGKAVAEVRVQFEQCPRCGQWVCRHVCWNTERGLCTTCAPKLDHEIAGIQASVQVEQLNSKLREESLIQNLNTRDVATGLCAKCGEAAGGGKFCQRCGAPLAAAPAAVKAFCKNCGSQLTGARFCGECGTPVDG